MLEARQQETKDALEALQRTEGNGEAGENGEMNWACRSGDGNKNRTDGGCFTELKAAGAF